MLEHARDIGPQRPRGRMKPAAPRRALPTPRRTSAVVATSIGQFHHHRTKVSQGRLATGRRRKRTTTLQVRLTLRNPTIRDRQYLPVTRIRFARTPGPFASPGSFSRLDRPRLRRAPSLLKNGDASREPRKNGPYSSIGPGILVPPPRATTHSLFALVTRETRQIFSRGEGSCRPICRTAFRSPRNYTWGIRKCSKAIPDFGKFSQRRDRLDRPLETTETSMSER